MQGIEGDNRRPWRDAFAADRLADGESSTAGAQGRDHFRAFGERSGAASPGDAEATVAFISGRKPGWHGRTDLLSHCERLSASTKDLRARGSCSNGEFDRPRVDRRDSCSGRNSCAVDALPDDEGAGPHAQAGDFFGAFGKRAGPLGGYYLCDRVRVLS